MTKQQFLSFFLFSNFDLGEDTARIGLFRYNNYVDEESQIHLSNFTDNKDDLITTVVNLPYGGEGNKIIFD